MTEISGFTEEEKKQVVAAVQEMGISMDDPMFQLMVILGKHEEFMIEYPAQMQGMIEAWAELIETKLQRTSENAQKMHHAVVTSVLREELKGKLSTSTLPQGKLNLSLWAGAIGAVLAIGALLGSMTTWNVTNLAKTPKNITSVGHKFLK